MWFNQKNISSVYSSVLLYYCLLAEFLGAIPAVLPPAALSRLAPPLHTTHSRGVGVGGGALPSLSLSLSLSLSPAGHSREGARRSRSPSPLSARAIIKVTVIGTSVR